MPTSFQTLGTPERSDQRCMRRILPSVKATIPKTHLDLREIYYIIPPAKRLTIYTHTHHTCHTSQELTLTCVRYAISYHLRKD